MSMKDRTGDISGSAPRFAPARIKQPKVQRHVVSDRSAFRDLAACGDPRNLDVRVDTARNETDRNT